MEIVERNDSLKLIAAVFMILDHVAFLFFPTVVWLRIPGRIVFPIFAYYIAFGVCHTSNFKKYMARLLGAALLTQPIYAMMLPGHWNVLFTLLYGGITIVLWEQKRVGYRIFGGILLLIAGVFSQKMSYGWYGVYMIFLFFEWGGNIKLCSFAMVVLQICYVMQGGFWIQGFSLLALPLIYRKNWGRPIRLPRYFFYVFYPAHLGILLLIRQLLFF